ncbi:MAG: hypothetical protein EBV64_13990 [Oxalobacteraceae bacterium]|nr:hypothetical protein [Oxalobacteraceae bacterium]
MPAKFRDQGSYSIRTLFRLSCVAAAVVVALGSMAQAQNSADKLPMPGTGAGGNPTDSAPSTSLPVQLIPNREAVLSSEVSTPIEKLPFRIGDSFNAGDVLVVLDCKELQASSWRHKKPM